MDYIINNMPMFSASSEIEKYVYKVYYSKNGKKRWLVADNVDNCAEFIYVEGDENSDGFGGRELEFTLVNGKKIKLKGPWHTNSDSFFNYTGVDIRDKYYTFVVISKDRFYKDGFYKDGFYKDGFYIMKDVVYKDDCYVLGKYDRYKDLVKKYISLLNQDLYVYSCSHGGSYHGFVKKEEICV